MTGNTARAVVEPAAVRPATPMHAIPVQADNDAHLVELWLHGRSPRTQKAYRADVAGFMAHTGRELRELTLGDLQAYQDSLLHLAPASQVRKISAVRSLLSKGHKLGYLGINLGAATVVPKLENRLSERYLAEDEVVRMLSLERNPRNKALLRLLYLGGLRISEACGLRCRHLQPNGDSGQVAVHGKGGKTRVILLKASLWPELAALRGNDPDAPIFRSRQRRSTGDERDAWLLDSSMVHRIVKQAARRAGLSAAVSCHWLRHAHVSHSLDRKVPIHLIQSTVGHASLSTTSKYAHSRPNESSSTHLPG